MHILRQIHTLTHTCGHTFTFMHASSTGVGKSTLMRAIAANKVDGFPPPEQLRTVYVEHDIQVGLEALLHTLKALASIMVYTTSELSLHCLEGS